VVWTRFGDGCERVAGLRGHAGVYAVIPGLPTLIRVWGGLLHAGAGAVASHQPAAWLDGFAHEPAVIEVTIPERRRVRPAAGLRIYRSCDSHMRTSPAGPASSPRRCCPRQRGWAGRPRPCGPACQLDAVITEFLIRNPHPELP